MRKIIVHQIAIKKIGQKVQFQIRIPRNAKKVTAINVTNNVTVKSRLPISSGFLFLRIPEYRDVFYAEDVRFYSSAHNQGTYPERVKMLHTLENGSSWRAGTKEEFFHIEVDVTCTIIEGLYVDYNKVGNRPYTISIYIELEL